MKINDFYKFWYSIFCLLVATIFGLIILSGCKAKPVETKTIEIKKDSISEILFVKEKIEISQPIKDSNAVVLPRINTGVKDCDSIANEKCDELLAMLNFYKKSGVNQSKSFYNKETRLYSTINEMGATISTLKDSLSQKAKVQYVFKDKIVEKQIKYVPKWVKVLAILGVVFILFLVWRFSKIFT